MNESGPSIGAALNFYKIKPDNLILLHDDKDIPFGETRVQRNRGDAGHNGVKSVIQSLGTSDFTRIRIGIAQKDKKIPDTADFVLHKFTGAELKILKTVFEHVLKEVQSLV
jgi:PTH1 family peptidyl-tRNA hydrolase